MIIAELMRNPCGRAFVGLSGSLLVTAVLTAAAPVSAQADADRATARALGLEGSQALDGHDYATAEDRFRRADRLVHAPTLVLGMARALAAEGKLVEATEAYKRIVREGVSPAAPEPFKRALRDASKEADEIVPRLGTVTILVKGDDGREVANATALLDGTPLNSASLGVRRVVDPGRHTLKVIAEGFTATEVRFLVPEGGSLNQPVTLAREPSRGLEPSRATNASPDTRVTTTGGTPPEPPFLSPETARSPLPWVAFGLGGAGLVVGAVAGIAAVGQSASLASACPAHLCTPDKRSDRDDYYTMTTVANVGFAAAGAGVAVGVVLLLTQSGRHAERSRGGTHGAAAGLRLTPVLGPASIGAVGQF
ncbi:MAG: hypothetical protein M3O50_05540 [Myxococcota bacterium]|nr:hypothetical protein [Myxococcota bacterium]